MIDADQWLEHSKELAAPPRRGAPKQVKLRRSISAAYYALFHRLIASAADQLVGSTHAKTPAYAIVYRAFDHGDMRQRCDQCGKAQLADKVKGAVGAAHFSPQVQMTARAFTTLQIMRHRADYDPRGKVTLSEASSAHRTAEQAMTAFSRARPEERRLFLLYVLFGAR